MQVVELHEGFGINKLHLVEHPRPDPEQGQVLVKIEAVALNYVDLLLIRGQINSNLQFPYVPVCDGAGVVERIGEGVTEFQPGDQVTTLFIPNWVSGKPVPSTIDFSTRPGLGNVPGQLSQYKVFQVNQLIKSPANLSAIEAATLPIAGLTAWNALRYGNLQAGQTVLLHGTGGVSIFALQFAKIHGAQVIITSSSDVKLERARQLGADLTINYKTMPEWEASVHEFTEGEGADLIIETVGGENLKKSIDALRMGGHISIMGLLNGYSSEIDTLAFLIKQATIKGMEVGSTRDFEEMSRAIVTHNIYPIVDRKFTFDQTQAAFEYLDQGLHFGKVIITL